MLKTRFKHEFKKILCCKKNLSDPKSYSRVDLNNCSHIVEANNLTGQRRSFRNDLNRNNNNNNNNNNRKLTVFYSNLTATVKI